MINKLKEQLKLRRIRRKARKYAQADKEFLRSTREDFLNLASQRAVARGYVPARRSVAYAYRAVGFAMVVVISMTGGLAAFAAKNDVPPDHPLYELKRITEQVQLKVSSPVKKVELHEVYAQRRLKEIAVLEKLEKVKPTIAPTPSPSATPTITPGVTASVSHTPLRSRQKIIKQTIDTRIEKLREEFKQERDAAEVQARKLKLEPEKRREGRTLIK